MDEAAREARRVPKYLDHTNQVFGRDLHDIGILIGGPVLLTMSVFNYATFLPGPAKAPIGVLFIGAGMILLWKQPTHLSATEWLEGVVHGIFLPTRVNHLAPASGMEREATDILSDGNWWETSSTTQELTGIKRIYPTVDLSDDDGVGMLELNDGSLISAVEVQGVNMMLASNEEWDRRVSELATVLNSLDFTTQIYVTTDGYDIDEHADTYRGRADDRDVTQRPILRAVLAAYLEQVVPSIEEGGLNRRRYFILTKMTINDVYTGEDGDSSLERVPVIGSFFGDSDGLELEERRDRMAEKLVERMRNLRSNMRSIQGCDAELVSAGAIARINHEYWSGRNLNSEVEDSFERLLPLVVGERSIDELPKNAEYSADASADNAEALAPIESDT